MSSGDIKPHEVFKLGGFSVSETMFSCMITVAGLVLFALVVRLLFIPRWVKNDAANARKLSGFRIMVESAVGFFDKNARETTGHLSGAVAPWYFAVVSLICIGILTETLGLRPPVADLNFALVMGLSTFLFFHFWGAREKKLRRFKRYLTPLVGQIFFLTDSIIPISLALRMFGSVFSGYMIMHLIYSLGWWSIGLNAVGTVMFTLFHAVVQSYIFFLLSMFFVAEAVE